MGKWNGYRRFCSLAKGLEIVGERWTLLIIQELSFAPQRYNQLKRNLPGIGSNVLADRLTKLEEHNIVVRLPEEEGQGVSYGLTQRGQRLLPAIVELRKWGVEEQLMINSTSDDATYDLSYGIPANANVTEKYQWEVDNVVTTLEIAGTTLRQTKGPSENPAVTISTTTTWMQKLVAGGTDWRKGRSSGDVQVLGPDDAWERMLLATAQPGANRELLELLTTRNVPRPRQ